MSSLLTPAPIELDDELGGIPDLPIQRLTVAQYEGMIRAGILSEENRVELLEGWLVPKMTKNPPHETAFRLLRRALLKLLSAEWDLDYQSPITLIDSVPEPDIAVVRWDDSGYAGRNPTVDDIGLVVEIADSSLRRDRGMKLRAYARAGIREYWIINLDSAVFEVYSLPNSSVRPALFEKRQDYAVGQSVPLILAGLLLGEVVVSDVLP